MTSGASNVTELLAAWSNGDRTSLDQAIPLIYNELKHLARRHLKREAPDRMLQTSSLIHEAYLRLVDQSVAWQSREHFFAIASQIMRRILVDHARSKRASKRGAGMRTFPLDESEAVARVDNRFLALDEALNKLEVLDATAAKVVELRFFGGLTNDEISRVLGVSSVTVQRRWVAARAWLQNELAHPPAG